MWKTVPKIKKLRQKCGKHGGKGEKVRKFDKNFSTLMLKTGLRYVYGQNWKTAYPQSTDMPFWKIFFKSAENYALTIT